MPRGPDLDSKMRVVPRQVLEYVSELCPRSHAIFCYDDDSVADQVFKAFLEAGFKGSEAVHIVTPSEDEYATLMRRVGIDKDSMEREHRLTFVPIEEFNVEQGHLSSAKALRICDRLIKDDRTHGFRGSRLTSLTEFYLEYASPAELVQFEHDLGLKHNASLSAICSYDMRTLRRRCIGDQLIDLFQHHGHIIGMGLAFSRDDSLSTDSSGSGISLHEAEGRRR